MMTDFGAKDASSRRRSRLKFLLAGVLVVPFLAAGSLGASASASPAPDGPKSPGHQSPMLQAWTSSAVQPWKSPGHRTPKSPILRAWRSSTLQAWKSPAAPASKKKCAPSKVLDLTGWKMTVPTGDDESPTEIEQPELNGYVEKPWFQSNQACDAVRFRAAVNGVTTEGSDYPRSELREMTADGSEEAAWSTSEGTHTMVVKEAITHLPKEKPEVVGGQVHGEDDDLTTFRLEGHSLYVTDGDEEENMVLITDNYKLGDVFKAKFVASDGGIEAFYNGKSITTVEADDDGAYFKAGAYTQANCEKSDPCEDSNYGETKIYSIKVNHTDGDDDPGNDDSGNDDSGNDDSGNGPGNSTSHDQAGDEPGDTSHDQAGDEAGDEARDEGHDEAGDGTDEDSDGPTNDNSSEEPNDDSSDGTTDNSGEAPDNNSDKPSDGSPAPETPKDCSPSDILDLTGWKMQMPTGDEESPDEIEQPDLDGYVEQPWYQPNENCDAVHFQAAVNGVTTEGSEYPRSELREMTADGSEEAAWSTSEGTHTLEVKEAITQRPEEKPDIVAAQVHGADDDLVTIRLEQNTLYATDADEDDNKFVITDDYQLGDVFTAKFVASDGAIEVFYNGESQTTIEADDDGSYFKAGAYTQANCENSNPCEDSNFGAAEIYDISVDHSDGDVTSDDTSDASTDESSEDVTSDESSDDTSSDCDEPSDEPSDQPSGESSDVPSEDCEAPGDILDLAGWKMTLPTGDEGSPDDIEQPDLDGFTSDPWFVANDDCSGVRFRSAVNGVTTEGSDYPRSELREMSADGSEEAAWSTSEGTHTMVVNEAITDVPEEKDEVVAAQVHGADDDLTTFRLEGTSLYVTDGDEEENMVLITDNYQLGDPFEAKFVASNGAIEAFYNGESVTTVPAEDDGSYFKAGAYTQANCEKSNPCDDSNYGEVEIYDISVSHDDGGAETDS